MREVQINGYTYNVKALKRKQVRQLRMDGYNLAALALNLADEAMDKVFALQFSESELNNIEELDQKDAIRLFKAVLAESFGSEDEEKNS